MGEHISSLSTAPPPPTLTCLHPGTWGRVLYTPCMAYTHRMWTATRQDLAAHARTHFYPTMGAHRLTRWLTTTLNAWAITMFGFRFWFRHSVAHTSFAMREQLAHPLLQLHSYAHSYLLRYNVRM